MIDLWRQLATMGTDDFAGLTLSFLASVRLATVDANWHPQELAPGKTEMPKARKNKTSAKKNDRENEG